MYPVFYSLFPWLNPKNAAQLPPEIPLEDNLDPKTLTNTFLNLYEYAIFNPEKRYSCENFSDFPILEIVTRPHAEFVLKQLQTSLGLFENSDLQESEKLTGALLLLHILLTTLHQLTLNSILVYQVVMKKANITKLFLPNEILHQITEDNVMTTSGLTDKAIEDYHEAFVLADDEENRKDLLISTLAVLEASIQFNDGLSQIKAIDYSKRQLRLFTAAQTECDPLKLAINNFIKTIIRKRGQVWTIDKTSFSALNL